MVLNITAQVHLVDVEERKALDENKRQIEQFHEEQKEKLIKKAKDREEVKQVILITINIQTLDKQVKDKKRKIEERKQQDQHYDKIIQNCPKEVVAIYPPISEISDAQKRNDFLKQAKELQVVLEEQM